MTCLSDLLKVERAFYFNSVGAQTFSFHILLNGTTRMTFTNDDEWKVQMVLDMTYPMEWLNAKAANDPEGRTNREVMCQVFSWSFSFFDVY